MRTTSVFLFAVLTALLVGAHPAHAQAPPELFAIVGEAPLAPPPGAMAVGPSRRWLVRPSTPWENTLATGRVAIALGDGGRVVAALQRVETGTATGAAFSGAVDGIEGAHASFVARNGIVAGAIHLPDATYLLSPGPGGVHVLEHLPDGAPACMGAMVPPQASRSPLQAGAMAALEEPASASAELATIDLLVVYTTEAVAAAGGPDALRASTDLAVLEMNTALANSQVAARVRLVHAEGVAYQESGQMNVDLGRLATRSDGFLDDVHAIRDRVGADLVTLVTETNTTGAAGQAFLLMGLQGDSSAFGFSVVMRRYIGGFVLAHEIGHNLGLNHDRANAGGGGAALPYAYGYQDPPHFRDVMAYACGAQPCPTIPHFSNPRVAWRGRPTGREETEDNARALQQTVPVVRRFRSPAPPVFTSLEPSAGPTLGGTRVTLRGSSMADVSQVRFGGRLASIESTSPSEVIVSAPSHVGVTVDVTLADQDGRTTSLAGAYRFVATSADSDGDALADEWERAFGLNPSSDTGDDGPTGDPDGDGIDNTLELERGGHPRGAYRRFFAEGATGALFDTRLSLANPSEAPVTAGLSFTLGDGTVRSATVTVPAMSRRTVNAADVPGLQAAEFSTVIETREPIAADRLMEWDPRERFGSHMETAMSRPRSVWYLAEGATHSGFALFYLLQNPLDRPVTVDVTFLLPAPAAPIVQEHSLAPNSRYNIWVNQTPALSSTDVSAVVRTRDGAEIIVERSMYLATQGKPFGAGHNSAAIAAPAPRWYFAEGATGAYFDTFLLIANPGDQPVTVDATYLLPTGATVQRRHVIAPTSRYNIWVDQDAPELADTAVSVVLETTDGAGIIAERAMWWPGPSPTWSEAHVAAGATTAAPRWVSSEGQQDETHETFLLIANPSVVSASAKVTMMFEDRAPVSLVVPLPASSRSNIAVGADFPEAFGKRFSTLVEVIEPGVDVVVERALYADAGGQRWAAGASALATPAPATLAVGTSRVDDGLLRVTGSAPWNATRVEVDGAPVEIADGAFTISGVPLLEGDNVVPVRAYSADGTLISESTMRVGWQPALDSSVEVTPSTGGTVRIDDLTNALAGARVEVPASAAERTFRLRLQEQRELHDEVPHAGWRAVGPAVSVGPLGEEFRGDVRIVLPVVAAALPAGVGVDAVVAYAYRDEGWVSMPIESRDGASVTVRVRDFAFFGLRLLVPEPVAPGELLITTDPGGASIAVGGSDTGLSTPARLTNQTPGAKSIRLYAPGFNEMSVNVDLAPTGTRLHVVGTRPRADAPQVQFTESGERVDVTDALYQLLGTVTRLGAAYPNARTYAMVNGREEPVGVGANGQFAHVVNLEPGLNTIRMRSTDMNGQTGVSRQLQVVRALTGAVLPDVALMPAKRPELGKVAALASPMAAAGGGPPVYVELSWDKDGTDVDLHVYDPDGNHAWYSNLRGIPGGALRYDDVDGFGPEVFEMPSARPGVYRVVVVYYSSQGRGSTTARVVIKVGADVVFNGTQSLAGTGSQWTAHSFTVAEGISILSATTPGGRDRLGHVFTTMAGENLLRLRVAASDTIADGDIRYEVRETSEGHVVDTSAISGRDVVIPLTHAPLTGLLSPRHGPRLSYEIVVTAPGGLRAMTRVQQDTRSQIRQEYVDKRELRRGFRWLPPARSALIDGAGMPALASPFGFQDLVAHSDYRDHGLAMVAQSAVIAESVARLYGKPLRITSGWRNPRRNDAVGGEEDSYHQSGDAVDLNPSWSKTQWPDATYEASQVTLWRRAQQLNARGHRYDVILHGSGNSRHLHVEPR